MSSLIQATPIFLLVLGVMIFIHEAGHFLVAKWLGIRVEVFSLGFGKRLFGFKRGDTDYRISLLPLGGYVKMAGDNIAEDRAGAPDEFLSHSKWHRFLVAIAGPVANILTAIAIPFIASMISYSEPAYLRKPATVGLVDPKAAGARAGIQPGDLIVKIDGVEVPTWYDFALREKLYPGRTIVVTVDRAGQTLDITATLDASLGADPVGSLGVRADTPGAYAVVFAVEAGMPAALAGLKPGDAIVSVDDFEVGSDLFGLIKRINEKPGQDVALVIRRGSETLNLSAKTVVGQDGLGRLGFRPDLAGVEMITTPLGPRDALVYAVDQNVKFLQITGAAIGQIFAGQRAASSALSGPIGILDIVDQAAKQGVGPVFDLMGLLSLNLGIFNLLPIPVLDGGLIFMLFLEWLLGLFGLQLSLNAKEKMINVGLVLIVLLMGFVFYHDIRKRLVGQSPAETPPAVTQPANANEGK